MMPVRGNAGHVNVQIMLATDPTPVQRAAWARHWTLLLSNEAPSRGKALIGGIHSNAASEAPESGVK